MNDPLDVHSLIVEKLGYRLSEVMACCSRPWRAFVHGLVEPWDGVENPLSVRAYIEAAIDTHGCTFMHHTDVYSAEDILELDVVSASWKLLLHTAWMNAQDPLFPPMRRGDWILSPPRRIRAMADGGHSSFSDVAWRYVSSERLEVLSVKRDRDEYMMRSDTPSRTAWWMLSLGWHPEESYITCSFREFCLSKLPEAYTKLFVYTETTAT